MPRKNATTAPLPSKGFKPLTENEIERAVDQIALSLSTRSGLTLVALLVNHVASLCKDSSVQAEDAASEITRVLFCKSDDADDASQAFVANARKNIARLLPESSVS